ncbi:mitochondrial transcription rescue factor 1 [Brachyhypopomus gauderio]|uniref:mitochondrial transcription rescue factor 1 n=1 Tax=Brachyhypopomus gauderio TaxID=698409 RepID=UPI00404112EF
MRGLSVQALTLRQLGQLSSPQLLAAWSGRSLTAWCPRTLHARQLWGSTSQLAQRTAALPKPWDGPRNWTLQQTRLKSTKGKGRQQASSLEEEEVEEKDLEASDYEDELQDDPGLPKDYKDSEKVIQSLRYDLVLKAGLDIARHKVEEAMYESKLRLNGQVVIKKSKNVKVGDTLDLIVGEDKDLDTVTVKRVILKRIVGQTKDETKHRVKLRSWKHLQLPRRDAFSE